MNYLIIPKEICMGLDLKGSELIIASLIFGFSQDHESWYYGSTQYMMDWTRTSKQNVLTTLSRLVERGIIEKKEVWNEGKFGKKCYYRFNFDCLTESTKLTTEVNKVDHRGKQSLLTEVNKVDHRGKQSLLTEVNKVDPNIIGNDNIGDNIDKNNIADNINYPHEKSCETDLFREAGKMVLYGVTPQQIGVTRKTYDTVAKKMQSLTFPFDDAEFRKKFFILACSPKWQKKTLAALQMNLNKLSQYELEFASELIDKSIAGGWQGVVFSNTPEEYTKWKQSRTTGQMSDKEYNDMMRYLHNDF
jgi:hypothetical protein